MASNTRFRVGVATGVVPFRTRDTVAGETRARRETSRMVAMSPLTSVPAGASVVAHGAARTVDETAFMPR